MDESDVESEINLSDETARWGVLFLLLKQQKQWSFWFLFRDWIRTVDISGAKPWELCFYAVDEAKRAEVHSVNSSVTVVSPSCITQCVPSFSAFSLFQPLFCGTLSALWVNVEFEWVSDR